MESIKKKSVRLAIASADRGFGYVIFTDKCEMLSWGTHRTREDTDEQNLVRFRDLLDEHTPSVVVIDDWDDDDVRRGARSKKLLKALAKTAKLRGLVVARCRRKSVQAFFSQYEATTLQEIATVVATQLAPTLAPILPAKRKIWESEKSSMAIFKAAALALTFCDTEA